MDFSIKKLGKDDIGMAKALFLFYQLDDGVKNPVLPSEEYLVRLLSQDNFHVLVAINDNKVIGGATAYELPMYKQQISELFIYEIAVEPEHRKQGVAAALISEIKKISEMRGIEVMYVGTETDNVPAQRLYSSTGGKREDIAWFTYGEDE